MNIEGPYLGQLDASFAARRDHLGATPQESATDAAQAVHRSPASAALRISSWRLDRVYFLAFLNPSRGQPDPALAARLASPASVGEPVTELD
jgi:hypothetical protein